MGTLMNRPNWTEQSPASDSRTGTRWPLAAMLTGTLAACGSGSLDTASTSATQRILPAATPTAGRANETFSLGDGATCQTSWVSVKLSPLALLPVKIFVKLCLPAGPVPNTVQLLVHGITYDSRYWDFADPTGGTQRYSYRHAANAAGFATAAIDRIGAGQSSHPLSATIDIASNTYVVHQIVSALRAGAVDGPGDNKPQFPKVILVGHSYGSWTSWFVASRYKDVDAVVLTGVSHSLRTVEAPLTTIPHLIPAAIDPQFDLSYDPGYLTSAPGWRYNLFCAPATVDPAVVDQDENTKGTMTATEIDTYPLVLQAPLDIRAPILLVNGNLDSLFCAPAGASQILDLVPGGVNCTSAAALIAAEQPHLGASVPSLDAFILPGGGHDLNFMLNAQDYFAVVQSWVQQKVGN